jgi:hypothetical protein
MIIKMSILIIIKKKIEKTYQKELCHTQGRQVAWKNIFHHTVHRTYVSIPLKKKIK